MEKSCPQFQKLATCDACQRTCEACGYYPAKKVGVRALVWEEYVQATCAKCEQQRWVNLKSVCETCYDKEVKPIIPFRAPVQEVYLCDHHRSTSTLLCTMCKKEAEIYAEGSTMCPECFYAGDYVINTLETVVCAGCTQPSHVNEAGLCRSCYVEKQVHTSKEDSKMAICQRCRKVTKRGQQFCPTCKKINDETRTCMGCEEMFTLNDSPRRKYSSFCPSCWEKRKLKICLKCNNELHESDDYIDERGWCLSCQDEYY